MNVAALFPRFAQLGFLQTREARPQRYAAAGPPAARHFAMAHNAILTLDNAPLQLRVLRGGLWITRDGCPADVVLGVGEVFEQRPGARVLVQALEASEVLVAEVGAGTQND